MTVTWAPMEPKGTCLYTDPVPECLPTYNTPVLQSMIWDRWENGTCSDPKGEGGWIIQYWSHLGGRKILQPRTQNSQHLKLADRTNTGDVWIVGGPLEQFNLSYHSLVMLSWRQWERKLDFCTLENQCVHQDISHPLCAYFDHFSSGPITWLFVFYLPL